METLDKFSAKFCRIVFYLIALVGVLNELDIFIIDKNIVRVIVGVTAVVLLPPTLLFPVVKNQMRWRYWVMTALTLEIGMLFTFLSLHAVFMFAFPVTLACIYGDKEIKNYTILLSYISLTVSHWFSVDFSIIFDDPFIIGHYEMMVFGFFPRLMCFFSYTKLLDFLVRRNATLLNNMVDLATDLHSSQTSIIYQFSTLSESKSGTTGQHIRRVSLLMEIFADRLNIGEEKDDLCIASMMHDIGKLMIDEAIIEKPGKLTDEEFEKVKLHTKYGYELLENSPGRLMEIARQIALDHHERWDGTGYSGKKGEEINYYARITSIVDVFDALMSRRSYKQPWTSDDTYNEIVSQAGKQFDPHLVEVFKECFPQLLQVTLDFPDE